MVAITMETRVARYEARKRFANKLKKLRAEAGITQMQIAEILDIDFELYSKWEQALHMPRVHNLIILANYFGVSIESLTEENGD